MGDERRAMIVGAGPVGLGAALFLARRGIATRVVERREHPSRESRALAVNPRTLELLEPSGVTRNMLGIGREIRGARLHHGGRVVGGVLFEGVHDRYPFMLALSQATTERLLEAALVEAGGAVERGVEMVECRSVSGAVEVELESGGRRETSRVPWLLGADGAHSTVRERMGIAFPGRGFARQWYLADVALRTGLDEDYAHAMFLKGGVFVFLIRVVDPALEEEGLGERGAPIWRVISNHPDPISLAEGAEAVGEPVWESAFHIAHRLCGAFARDGVYLAGDSAHIHSPIGARGMNLGLEDAWVLAELAGAGRLDEYEALRRAADRAVVRRVALLSRLAASEPAALGVLRKLLLPLALRMPLVRGRMRRVVTGLDHSVAGIESGRP